LIDVLRHEPNDGLEQSRAGRAPGPRVVVLLDEHGREAARSAEVFDDAFEDFCAVGDVGSAGFDLGKPKRKAVSFNLPQSLLAAGFGPPSLFALSGLSTAAADGNQRPVANPEMLARRRVRNAAALA
jgi:hypothetical protein